MHELEFDRGQYLFLASRLPVVFTTLPPLPSLSFTNLHTKQAHVSSLVLHHLAQMMADNSGPVGLLWKKACMYFKKGIVASQQV